MRQFSDRNRSDPHQRRVDTRKLLSGAIAHHRKGQLPEAENRYRRILQVEPKHAEALHLIGVIAYQQGHYPQAVQLISKAIEYAPANPIFHNNLGLALEASGQPARAEESYQEALRMSPAYADAHNNLGNILRKEGRFDAAVAHFKKTIKLDPRMPQAYLNLACALADKEDLRAAIALYQRAIDLRPDYEKAYNNLGNALRDQGQIDAAIENFRQAVHIKPNYVGALNNLGNALRACNRLDEAFEILLQAVEAAPHSAESHCNLGNAFKDSGRFENALDHYKKAIQFKPDFAEAHFNAAIVHLLSENFSEGWKEYEWRWQRKEWQALCFRHANLPRWDGQTFRGKKLLVYDEQGFGDTLQFVRYLPFVKNKGGEVIFETRRELIRLLGDFQGADAVIERSSYADPPLAADGCISLLSLPGIYKTHLETIPNEVPYIFADAAKAKSWHSRLDKNGFRVGVVWAGQPIHGEDRNRSCVLNQFKPLLEIAGVRLIGLQKGPAARQRFNQQDKRIYFVNLGQALKDFADTAALIENLDLVISVDTAVAHLAGAMGKPVWVLLPFIPDWRWMMNREDSPWYPTMRLFRQQTRGDWNGVIGRIARELRAGLSADRDMKEDYSAARLAEDYYHRGNYHYDLNDLSSAIFAYQKAIELNNSFFEAHFYLGKIFQDRQDFETALSYYQKALRINPESYQVCYNLGVVLLAEGRLVEAASALQQAIALKPDFPAAYNNLGVAFQKQGKFNPAIECFQKAVELQPAFAPADYNMGHAYHAQGQLDAAIQSYQAALAQKPDYPEAFHGMGLSLQKQGKLAEAVECYRKALQLKSDYVDAHYGIGNVFLDQDNLEEMTRWYQKALEFTPQDAQAYNNLGRIFQDQRKPKEAESCFRRAICIKPDFAEAHFNRSITLLSAGNYTEGWQEYEWRFKTAWWKNIYPYQFEKPRWDGTRFAGQKIFVHCEQGLGDTIQFVRYLPMVKARGGKVTFEIQKPLIHIFDHITGIDQLMTISSHKQMAEDFDFHVPLLSLPYIFQTTLETIPTDIPYISADRHKRSVWQKIVDKDRFKVGIVWAGGNFHKKDNNRSLGLKQFLPLSRIAGVRLYGLQKGPASQQVEEFSDQIQIENYGEEFEDFSDTTAFIDNLDLVISVDTAVAHLTGAMGKPVWVLLPFIPDWRWMLDRDDTPWYPTMRLFRQQKRGDWNEAMQSVANELSQWVQQRTASQNWTEENCK